jgi:hypothetical protein
MEMAMNVYQRAAKVLGALAFCVVVAAVSPNAQARDLAEWVKIGTYSGEIHFTVPDAQAVYFGNGVNCGNAAHRTANGQRYFSHGHKTFGLPQSGLDDNGTLRQNGLTSDTINAFWDALYGISHVGNADHTSNCWAYALGYGCWIQDPSWILADDYDVSQTVVVGVDSMDEHMKKITGICNNEPNTNTVGSTSEKCRASAIYNFSYYCPGGGTHTAIYKPK